MRIEQQKGFLVSFFYQNNYLFQQATGKASGDSSKDTKEGRLWKRNHCLF